MLLLLLLLLMLLMLLMVMKRRFVLFIRALVLVGTLVRAVEVIVRQRVGERWLLLMLMMRVRVLMRMVRWGVRMQMRRRVRLMLRWV
jgi:hypothetical protein